MMKIKKENFPVRKYSKQELDGFFKLDAKETRDLMKKVLRAKKG